MKSDDKNEIIIYRTEDGQTKIDVRFADETVWLSQAQLVALFQTSKSNISEHIKHIFEEGELEQLSVVRNFRTTAADGKTYEVIHYNLDVIISVGYRVKSITGTQFRQWATQRLKEYIIKGFTMNDDLLKKAGGGDYFDELLQRIRDIRASEKVFWKKVLEIYATSVDYTPDAEVTVAFFKTVQNKMHWASHGHTAAEVIFSRADADKPFMGMTAFSGTRPKKADVTVAKNYLSKDEINILGRMVTAYLDIAELQAMNRNPMTMQDWTEKLDGFLRMTGKDVLQNAGTVSYEDAKSKALQEYEKFKMRTKDELSQVETHFLQAIEKAEKELTEGEGKA